MRESNLEEILAESREMRRRHPFVSGIHLILPPAILLATIGLLWWSGVLGRVSAAAVTSFLTLGKLIILTGALPPEKGFDLSAAQLALMVLFMDTLYAYVLAFNLHYVYRVPRVGPWLERVQSYCRWWLVRQPWLKRWAFTGVMLFVMFPLTGTGAPGGSIMGRLMGLRPTTTVAAIFLGSALGCGLMAAFAAPLEPIFHDIQHQWWFNAIGVLILAIVIALLFVLGRKLSRAADEYARSEGGQA